MEMNLESRVVQFRGGHDSLELAFERRNNSALVQDIINKFEQLIKKRVLGTFEELVAQQKVYADNLISEATRTNSDALKQFQRARRTVIMRSSKVSDKSGFSEKVRQKLAQYDNERAALEIISPSGQAVEYNASFDRLMRVKRELRVLKSELFSGDQIGVFSMYEDLFGTIMLYSRDIVTNAREYKQILGLIENYFKMMGLDDSIGNSIKQLFVLSANIGQRYERMKNDLREISNGNYDLGKAFPSSMTYQQL